MQKPNEKYYCEYCKKDTLLMLMCCKCKIYPICSNKCMEKHKCKKIKKSKKRS